MGRYTGPVCRICRRYGMELMLKGDRCASGKCGLQRRPTPPGQRSPRRRRISDRGLQLREKQKLRFAYGLMERQFRRYYEDAVRRPGITGENILKALELRFDNVVYRMGFADSRRQARQLIQHGHFTLNGRKAAIPSTATKVGDVIAWQASSQKSPAFESAREGIKGKNVPAWLTLDMDQMSGRVAMVPEIGYVDLRFEPAAVVEYYSR